MQREVSFEVRENVAHVRLNRPRVHNALSPEIIRELAITWQRFSDDHNCRVAILSGVGPSFCSGMDIKRTDPGFGWQVAGENTERLPETLPGNRRSLAYIPPADCFKPIIGLAHGFTMGGGLELLLNCDIRYAAAGTRFAFPEVRRGLLPSSGATFWLPLIVGFGPALELIASGREFDANEALRLGLVDRVLDPSELLAAAEKLARTISSNAPLAVQAVKEAMKRSLGAGLQEALNISENLSRTLRFTKDYHEGVRAFAEKRAAKFSGH